MTFNANVRPGKNLDAALKTLEADAERRIASASLVATKKASRIALTSVRRDMASKHLGKLPNALAMTSDADKGSTYKTSTGFKASGVVYVRSGSERTRGAIESYTAGANIMPRTGRWLWIRTKEIQRIAGAGRARSRVTPGNWKSLGMDAKVGPLILIKGIDGRPLLAIENVGTGGRKGTARNLTKSGRARKGQRKRELVIAFVAIPRTTRAARVDIDSHLKSAQGQLQALFETELGRSK